MSGMNLPLPLIFMMFVWTKEFTRPILIEFSEEPIRIIFVYDWLQIVGPVCQIDVVFESKRIKIESFSGGKKRKTEAFCDLVSMATYPEKMEYGGHENSHEPHSFFTCYDEKIDVRVFVWAVHGDGVADSNHAKPRDPADEPWVFLCLYKKLQFFFWWGVFKSEMSFEFLKMHKNRHEKYSCRLYDFSPGVQLFILERSERMSVRIHSSERVKRSGTM